MSDIVKKAKRFAIEEHKRINHTRMYTNQPYDVHLKNVSEILKTVTQDENLIAASWLHDVVEDTPATHENILENFGETIADLVKDLTDVSRPGDGNRSIRKELDRQALANGSNDAKTIKLADLIDNVQDIVKHDAKFSQVFLPEAQKLLEVLIDGSDVLFLRAQKLIIRSARNLGVSLTTPCFQAAEEDRDRERKVILGFKPRILKSLINVVKAKDIAEPLLSFDCSKSANDILEMMYTKDHLTYGVRADGTMTGYVLREDLDEKEFLGQAKREFSPDQIVDEDATLPQVIMVLNRFEHCFVQLWDGIIIGVILKNHLESSVGRMWLFGIISYIETMLLNQLREIYPNDTWVPLCPKARVDKARLLLQERIRMHQSCDLLDCLQFSDKAKIIIKNDDKLKDFGYSGTKEAERSIRQIETLRNLLAHGQPFVNESWAQIVRMSQNFNELVNLSTNDNKKEIKVEN